MNSICKYISEKLIINKNIKLNNDKDEDDIITYLENDLFINPYMHIHFEHDKEYDLHWSKFEIANNKDVDVDENDYYISSYIDKGYYRKILEYVQMNVNKNKGVFNFNTCSDFNVNIGKVEKRFVLVYKKDFDPEYKKY